MSKLPVRLLAAVLLSAVPLAAAAQSTPAFSPAEVQSGGSTSSAAAGAGVVMVQVFVKADGSFNVTKVLSSTNTGDNKAALEMARTSTYSPAQRNGKAIDSFYDYQISFSSGGQASTGLVGSGAYSGSNAAAYKLIRAGKYDAAKAQLQTSLAAKPDDPQAYGLLGAANYFLGDDAGAAAAFSKAGTIPGPFKILAIESYQKYGQSLASQKNYSGAVDTANSLIALDPDGIGGYALRGEANLALGNNAAAVTDLEKAQSLAPAAKLDGKNLATLEFNLMGAELATGQIDKATTLSKDVVRDDPSLRSDVDHEVYVAINNSGVTLANAGKSAEAVARFEAGATAFPADAGPLYAQAAYVMYGEKNPDWSKVKAEAGKSLAADPTNGRANFVAGIAAAKLGDTKSALTYLNKAKASPAYSTDVILSKQVDDALKQLNSGGNAGSY